MGWYIKYDISLFLDFKIMRHSLINMVLYKIEIFWKIGLEDRVHSIYQPIVHKKICLPLLS